MPRRLQAQIHSNFSLESGTWTTFQSQIAELTGSIDSKEDFNDHLIREYNKKIVALNQPQELLFSPYDAGFRYIG